MCYCLFYLLEVNSKLSIGILSIVPAPSSAASKRITNTTSYDYLHAGLNILLIASIGPHKVQSHTLVRLQQVRIGGKNSAIVIAFWKFCLCVLISCMSSLLSSQKPPYLAKWQQLFNAYNNSNKMVIYL